MLNITILTKYPSQGASSRYRYFLYIHNLLKEDVNIEIDSFVDTSYLNDFYNKKNKNKFKLFIAYLKRFFVLINSSDNLIIEYEAFPYLPYFLEKLFLKNKKYILNFDDNVWANYENKLLLKNKLDNLVKNASGVIVANEFLERKVLKLNHNIIKIPTVIDLEHYKQNNDLIKFDKFTLVWIGAKTTYGHILSHKHIFQKLSELIKYKLVIIATKNLSENTIDGVDMVFYDWSSKMEVEILKKSHIGIMPLDDNTFSQGKSSFKIIQYMASGLPIIASDVGENANVLIDNKTGFLVRSDDEWISAIMKLYKNKNIYDDFSELSRVTAYEYSIQKYFKDFIVFIKDIFSK